MTTSTREQIHRDRATHADGSQALAVEDRDQTGRESFLGTDRSRGRSNISWGAIFAGVATFLALMIVFAMAAGAMGLGEASATTVGIWSVIFVVIALAAAGYIAGALAVRGGLLHGFLTWAASMLASVLLVGWAGSSVLGAVGGALGNVVQAGTDQVTTQDVQQMIEEAQGQVDQQDVQQAQDEAAQTAEQAADAASTGLWWGFAGSLIGAAVASFTGAAGSRSVQTKREDDVHVTTRS